MADDVSPLQVSRSSPVKRKYADDDDGRRRTNTVNLVCENGLFFHTSAPGVSTGRARLSRRPATVNTK